MPTSVRLSGDQVAALEAAAQRNGTTVSDLLREGARQVVDPTRGSRVTASVNEALPYRFDRLGNLGAGPQYDFSTDVIAGLRDRDGVALNRALAFMREQFDTDRADVSALNPARQRPDLYVDQRTFRNPVWDSISKGTLEDGTPFVLPKFASASGLVSNHTEGEEPDAGTYTATSQTITPSAVSGRVEITREAWDQGGNPALSGIIWRQMTRAWFEALEASAVQLLDGLSPTQITLPPAATNTTLADALINALAPLQFIRGGFAMDTMFTQVDLYTALAGAKDADGRPLFPVLGPANTNGRALDRFGALDVAGITALPSWALAASGTVAASSYLFDPESVHGWATAPQRLEMQYR
ncbi:CopG family transcriptional regulator, partial [Micromonospora musae]|uniref:ribbon-helix-helix domain-containing protein n=1 Tax=Micromonospora musae TaxID=1894970 RepID=UPI0033C73203